MSYIKKKRDCLVLYLRPRDRRVAVGFLIAGLAMAPVCTLLALLIPSFLPVGVALPSFVVFCGLFGMLWSRGKTVFHLPSRFAYLPGRQGGVPFDRLESLSVRTISERIPNRTELWWAIVLHLKDNPATIMRHPNEALTRTTAEELAGLLHLDVSRTPPGRQT